MDALVLVLICLFVALLSVGLLTLFAGFFLPSPFVPSSWATAEHMIDYADLKPGMHVIDIGAGDGRLLIAAKRRCPDITAVGYEIIPTLVWLSRLHAWLRRSSVDLRHGNAFAQDYSKADVIFLYLMPNFLTDLESKFDRELKKGTRVISQAFRFPSRTPMRELMWKDRYRRKRMFLYEW